MSQHQAALASIPNTNVRRWVEQCIELCQPDHLYVCNGSKTEKQTFLDEGCKAGVFLKLNEKKWPGCYYHQSDFGGE